MTGRRYLSFAAQTRHYFDRPHVALPAGPIQHPAAWMGSDLQAQPERWLVKLTPALVHELERAVARFEASGQDLENLDSSSFELPELAEQIENWRDAVRDGIGFVVVRGLPVTNWTEQQAQIAFWGIGHHMGRPGGQNPDEELLGHVTDYGETDTDPYVRLYRTAANINFHCDAADVVGLLCLRPAKQGGQSRIVSTLTLFNALYRAHPDLVPVLFEPFLADRRDRLPAGAAPVGQVVPCRYDGSNLRTFYHSEYFRSVERHDGIEIDSRHRRVLDFYDQLGADPRYHLDMWLQPGDAQFLSNHHIAHARTAYQDFSEPARKRHLLRLWLSIAGEYGSIDD